MNFKNYYEQNPLDELFMRTQDEKHQLREAWGDYGSENAAAAGAVGKATKGALGLVGKTVGKIVGGVAGAVVGAVTGKNIEQWKAKWKNAIAVAKKVYPHDIKVYAELEKMQEAGKSNILQQYMALRLKRQFGQKWAGYSPGIDLVFRAFDDATEMLKFRIASGKSKNRGKDNMSMRSLDEATQNTTVGKVTFKKLADAKAVDEYWKANNVEGRKTQLRSWIETASYFSYWKNKYNGHDDEDMGDNIVTQILSTGLLKYKPIEIINEKMMTMEEKDIEVNAENLMNAFNLDIGEQVDAILKTVDAQARIMDFDGEKDVAPLDQEKVTDEQVTNFVTMFNKTMQLKVISDPVLITRCFIGFTYLAKMSGRTGLAGELAKQSSFGEIFRELAKEDAKVIKAIETGKLSISQKTGLTDTEEEETRANFIRYLDGYLPILDDNGVPTATYNKPSKKDFPQSEEVGQRRKLWNKIRPERLRTGTAGDKII